MPTDRELILQAEDRRIAALVALDIAALDALFADGLVHIHSNGLVQNKTEILARIGEKKAFAGVERGPLEVRICGDVAVMTGRITNFLHGPNGTQTTMKGIVTQVLKREAGGWRFWNFQFTLSEL